MYNNNNGNKKKGPASYFDHSVNTKPRTMSNYKYISDARGHIIGIEQKTKYGITYYDNKNIIGFYDERQDKTYGADCRIKAYGNAGFGYLSKDKKKK